MWVLGNPEKAINLAIQMDKQVLSTQSVFMLMNEREK